MINIEFWNFDPIPWEMISKLFYFMTHIDFTPFYPQQRPKNDFLLIWAMCYQFRHVWKGQITCASELNNEDPWKKIGTLNTKIGPAATKIVKFDPNIEKNVHKTRQGLTLLKSSIKSISWITSGNFFLYLFRNSFSHCKIRVILSHKLKAKKTATGKCILSRRKLK